MVGDDKYIVLLHFWLPSETLELRVRRDKVPYDVWEKQGLFHITDLQGDGFTTVPIAMNFKDMSPGMKELYKLLLEGKMIHSGNPLYRRNCERL